MNKRWSTGTGEIKWKARRSGGRICIDFYEPASGFGHVLRALVWIHNKKDFEVILFQGLGHKDTKTRWPRWQNVESVVLRHLSNIDRGIGRPGNKFKFPTLKDATAPIVGDVVVIRPNVPDYGRYEGYLGVVKEVLPDYYKVVITDWNSWIPCEANKLEVIDHIPDFFKLFIDELSESSRNANKAVRQLQGRPGNHDEDLLKDPEDVPAEELKKARNYVFGDETPKVIEPLDLPGGKGSWLLAIDVSGSMIDDDIRGFIANYFDEFGYKVAETVTFDTTIKRKYVGMPNTCDLDLSQNRGGTEIDCVLGHALVNGYHNILVFSDGFFNNNYALKKDHGLNVLIVKTPEGKPETLAHVSAKRNVNKDCESPVFEEDGWEYWLEMSSDNGLYLWKKCKTCKSRHPLLIRNIKW